MLGLITSILREQELKVFHCLYIASKPRAL
jgi:hypothetical protein